ncbi:MAG: hypothetical protein ACRDHW_11660, partial [Ktedonobacteraceae bacterium]
IRSMQDETGAYTSTGVLTYNQEHHCLALDNIFLHNDDPLTVEMFGGHWISGYLQQDAQGWYLLTPYHTGIRLHPGLIASITK